MTGDWSLYTRSRYQNIRDVRPSSGDKVLSTDDGGDELLEEEVIREERGQNEAMWREKERERMMARPRTGAEGAQQTFNAQKRQSTRAPAEHSNNDINDSSTRRSQC